MSLKEDNADVSNNNDNNGSCEEADKIDKLCAQYPDLMEQDPELLTFLVTIFLKFRRFNYEQSAERLANYIKWRMNIFGCFEDQVIGQEGMEEEESGSHARTLQQQLATGFLQVLPRRLSSGEAILYLQLNKHNSSVFSSSDTLRTWHFVIMRALRASPDIAEHGFVMMGNMAEVGLLNIDTSIPQAIAPAAANCMPIRLVNAFAINPPWVARFIIPLMKFIMSQKFGQRLNLITDVAELQSEFQMPASHLPTTLGGTLQLTTDGSH